MHGLPGGGAEMLVEGVRKDVSPKKVLPRIETRHGGGTISSFDYQFSNVIGFGESLERGRAYVSTRDLQDSSLEKYGIGFTSFIAWPVQLEVNSFGRRNRGQNKIQLGAGSTEYLRHVAVSRLFLDSIPNIQSSWPTMGIKTAQMALFAGANDVGSTMMEERRIGIRHHQSQCLEIELQNVILRTGFSHHVER